MKHKNISMSEIGLSWNILVTDKLAVRQMLACSVILYFHIIQTDATGDPSHSFSIM